MISNTSIAIGVFTMFSKMMFASMKAQPLKLDQIMQLIASF